MVTSPGTLLPPCALMVALEACWFGWVWVFSYSDPSAVDSSCLLRYAPCAFCILLWPWLDSCIHRYYIVSSLPYVSRTLLLCRPDFITSPLIDWFVHPSLLHRFASTFAPCFTHTPPLTDWFVHPSLLHFFFFVPCLLQAPPFWAKFVHPAEEQIFLFLVLANFPPELSSRAKNAVFSRSKHICVVD